MKIIIKYPHSTAIVTGSMVNIRLVDDFDDDVVVAAAVSSIVSKACS